jgi:hypothetical protein
MGLLAFFHFHFAFTSLESVPKTLDFHFNNHMRGEGGNLRGSVVLLLVLNEKSVLDLIL